MNRQAINQVKTLLSIKTDNYRKKGDYRPEVAAQFAVDSIISMYRGQMEHINQLLDEEIEDAVRAGAEVSE